MVNPNTRFNDPRYIKVTSQNLGSGSSDAWIDFVSGHFRIVDINYMHSVVSSAAETMDVKVVRAGTAGAVSAGTSVLASPIALNSASYTSPATVPSIQLSTTVANLILAPGDKLGRDMSGTPTDLQGGLLQIILEPR